MATSALGTWQPLLDGELQAAALTAAAEIADELRTRAGELVHEGSLACGQAGLATTLAYLDQALPGRGYGEAAAAQLDAALDYMSAVPIPPGLYGGFSGIAWAASRIDRMAGRSNDGEEFAEIDDLLLDMLSATSWDRHYDLIDGLAGLGVYALERLPHPKAYECLTRIVEHLDRWAERSPSGVTWRTPVELLPGPSRAMRPQGEYNLGMAHGAPGAIALLAQASAAGVAADAAARLVDGAVPWLLAQRLPNSPGASFEYETGFGDSQGPSRSAWCYGDPGVAAALLCAARCRGNSQWEREAIELAVAAANRPEPEMQIADAGFCHGWAGLAHVFNRLYQTSGEPQLAEAARRFCQRTLAARHADRGIAGYAAWLGDSDGKWGWRDEAGLLEGAAGVALGLAAAASDVPPLWDSVLLISNTVEL